MLNAYAGLQIQILAFMQFLKNDDKTVNAKSSYKCLIVLQNLNFISALSTTL